MFTHGEALAGLGKEWSRLWNEFQHNVNVATNSLICLLEAIHGKHLVERQRLIQAVDASGGTLMTLEDAVRAVGDVCFVPAYSTLRARPLLSGEPLFGRTSPGGSMERTAFNGWLYEVWNLWESRYRTQLKHEVRDLSGAIRPRQQVLGDLRHIRNNLLHNGVAKRGEAASCEILRWFAEGEKMQVRLRHVFDFLNQMGWLHEESIIFLADRGSTSRWLVDRTGEPESPPPSLISVRPLFNPEQQDPRFRYEASMVFENGVFGRTPMGPEREETEAQAKDRTRKWMTMTVSGDGNLYVPDLGTVSAAVLYRNHLKGAKQPAPGISCIPSFCQHQITPKTSRYTRCSMSMFPNVSINGRIRSSGQLGRWWYSIHYCPTFSAPQQHLRVWGTRWRGRREQLHQWTAVEQVELENS